MQGDVIQLLQMAKQYYILLTDTAGKTWLTVVDEHVVVCLPSDNFVSEVNYRRYKK